MATVTNTIRLPGGGTPTTASVEISLVASATASASAAGWITATDVTVLSTVRPIVTAGAWSADLTPNSGIDPSGTVYRITEYVGRDRYVHYIAVGSGGGTVHDLLTTAPAAVTAAHNHNTLYPLMLAAATFTYDGDGNVLTETSGGDTTTYTYDADGNIDTADRGGVTFEFTYDADGNLTEIAEA